MDVNIPNIQSDPLRIVKERISPHQEIPAVSDQELQERLAIFEKDGTGRSNTDALIGYDILTAAAYCRSFCIPGTTDQRRFDLCNVYEAAILWLESSNIDKVDKSSVFNLTRMIGHTNPYGRFNYERASAIWTSSIFSESRSWQVSPQGTVAENYSVLSLLIIPTRVEYKETKKFLNK